MIRSQLLKNVLMILMSKNMLPTDRLKLKALISEFRDTVQWKIMIKMDEVEKMRQVAAAAKIQKRITLDSKDQGGVKAIQGAVIRERSSQDAAK